MTGGSIEKSFSHLVFDSAFGYVTHSNTRVLIYVAGWVQPVRNSLQTLPIKQHLFGLDSSGNRYPYVHMRLCLCVCFMSGLCRLLGFAAAYLYSVLWNIFQTLWLTWGDPTPHPSAAPELYHENRENWHVHVEMRCLHHLCLRSLRHRYDISEINACVSWKIWTKMSCTCSSEIVSRGVPVKSFLAR